MNCNQPIETTYLGDLPIDTLDALPDFFIVERDIYDETTGNTTRTLTRVPSKKILPNGNFDNIAFIEANNTAIEVPEGQVRGGYIKNEGSRMVMHFADLDTAPDFLILGKRAGLIMIQNTGFLHILGGHDYIIGQDYYQGRNGEPTTDNTSGKKLFKPLSRTILAVKL